MMIFIVKLHRHHGMVQPLSHVLILIFLDKTNAESQFEKLKRLWENKNLLIVEGATSRSGVGNDLFDQALSIKRIVCSSHCAYKDVDAIESTIRKYADNHLILIMLAQRLKY